MIDVKIINDFDLLYLDQNLKSVYVIFQFIIFRHVYWEHNDIIDSLSKEAINLEANLLIQDEYSSGELLSHKESNFFYL
jgi:hypothetical protein